MTKKCLVWIAAFAFLGVSIARAEDAALTTQKQKVSYGIGLNIGTNLKQESIDVDQDALIRGMKDALSGATPAMTEAEVRATLEAFQKEMAAKKEADEKLLSEKNAKEGEAFLAENAKKEGVVTLPSGLQYKVLQAGTGPKPKETDTVTTNYRGSFIDGKSFDSSYDRKEPATFPVHGVIPGWTEALQLMPVGSKWQLFIPAKLAYGEKGAGGVIAPNATLIFEIELIAIKEAEAQK